MAVIIFGNVMRREQLQHVTAGEFCGDRVQLEMNLDSLLSWHGKVLVHKLMHAVGDLRMWRSMITMPVSQPLDDTFPTGAL